MSARPKPARESALSSPEGELVFLRITVDPRTLEQLLEALAALSFPVNPQLYHRPAQVVVEFPAYSERLLEVRDALGRQGLSTDTLEVNQVLGQPAG